VYGDPYGAGVDLQSRYGPGYPLDTTLSTGGDNWFAGNYHNGRGAFNVKEAYVEFNIPFLKSATFGEANLNIADRQKNTERPASRARGRPARPGRRRSTACIGRTYRAGVRMTF
jgi:hypothetical protein